MPLPSDYISGTINLTNGSVDFTGTGTGWLAADFREGDIILDIAGGGGRVAVVQTITGNAAGTLSKAWDGPTLTGVAYRIRYQWDSSRVSAQTRTMIEKLGNGNLESFSGVTGPGVVVMDGPHSVIVKPESDFINGVAYDVQVDTLPDRDAYDGQSVGFAVLVSDVGDGRSAIYSKASNTVADWTDPAYVTGPVGPEATIEVSGTNTLPPGSAANVTATPVPGGVELEFDIPSGRGMTPRGTYNPATAYVLDDSVLDNGSTWIALQATTGNAPPVLPTTSNAYWQLLARKGTDGAGTGDVVGPASAADNQFALYDGTTGKLIKAATPAAAAALLPLFSTLKGLTPGATSGDVAANRLLRADGTWIDPPTNADLEFTVSQLALIVADNSNVAIFLGPSGNRVADTFDALTYVDVAGATNLDTSVAGVLKPTMSAPSTAYTNTGGEGNRVGTITVTTTFGVSAGVVSNLIDGSETPGATNSVDFTASLGDGEYIRFDFGSNKYIDEVNWRAGSAPGAGTFKVRGSNNASAWTDLASFTMDSVNKVIPLTGVPGAGFRYYEITKTTTQTQSRPWYTEVRFKIAPPSVGANLLTVRSAAFTALSAPTKMKALIQVKEVDAAVAGTDYTLECSRDNGTTWALMTLTELYTLPSGLRVVDVGEISVAGQPSGTSPRWRFKTLNNKNVELHDVYLYWSN